MLVSPSVQEDEARRRIERNAAIMLAAVRLHKQDTGLPPAELRLDGSEVALVQKAREALDTALKSNGHDLWGVVHNLNFYASTRIFLHC